jgi:hypothetical protein
MCFKRRQFVAWRVSVRGGGPIIENWSGVSVRVVENIYNQEVENGGQGAILKKGGDGLWIVDSFGEALGDGGKVVSCFFQVGGAKSVCAQGGWLRRWVPPSILDLGPLSKERA